LELRYLEIFQKVVELKSFSRAADALYITQPTVSSHIKTLEDDLEIKLLDRLGREIVPTKAGDVLYDYAKEIVKLKKEAKQALDQFIGKMRGNLEVGGSTIPGEYILPQRISEFKKLFPEIVVTLRIGDTKDVTSMVLEGKAEIGVVGARIEDIRIESREFMRDSLIFVAPPSFSKTKISIKDLIKIPLILREKGSGSRKAFEKIIKKNALENEDLNIVAEMGSTEAVKQSVKSGLGLSVLSRLAVQEELSNNTLKEVKVPHLSMVRSLYILTNKQRVKSPLCHVFLEYLYNKK
tara:strand:+ start:13294 stop:14175 length:882 start_codon:yes stop_codon:yes gene_type:complete